MSATLKPWPGDAVMIVAERVGHENRAAMESVVEAECRDCGAKLAADSFTLRTAENLPSRLGRPIKFFCVQCCFGYDPRSTTEVHDHSEGGSYADAYEGLDGLPRKVFRRDANDAARQGR